MIFKITKAKHRSFALRQMGEGITQAVGQFVSHGIAVGLVVVGVADSGVVVGFVEAAVADVLGNPAEWYSAHVSR